MLSYGVCIILSWAYVIIVISNTCLVNEKCIASEVGKSFAIIYSIYVSLTYFTQLTVIRHNTLPTELVNVFNYSNASSWIFSLNLIGYGIMAISTFFVGLSINPLNKDDRYLRNLLLLHGVFIISIFMPITSIFLGESNDILGTIALIFWCLFFLPIGFLFNKRFLNK
jgi:hypothetical protein